MTIKKPNVTIRQTYAPTVENQVSTLNTLLVGPRYDISDKAILANYLGSDTHNHEYDYPGLNPLSQVSTDSVQLFLTQAMLKYYSTTVEKWRKVGAYSNRIRTILADSLIFKSAPSYPRSSIFGERDVQVGDKVIVKLNDTTVESKVTGFEPDFSGSWVDDPTYHSSNKQTQTNIIGSATPGPNQGDAIVTPNTGGTYSGDLYKNVLEDTYRITVLSDGEKPIFEITKSNVALPTITVNDFFDSSVSDTYTIKIISIVPQVQYIVTSLNTDNSGPFVFPAISTPTAFGTKGSTFTRTDAGTFAINDTYTIVVTPSEAHLSITTASGIDQNTNRVFPGFGKEFSIGKISTTFAGTTIKFEDYWTVSCQKAIDAITLSSSGTYAGTTDAVYAIRVIQGGIWGQAIIEITSTNQEPRRTVTATLDEISFGIKIQFDENTQTGLVKDDIFMVQCHAAQETGYKTIILDNSLMVGADTCTIGAAQYSGVPGVHNICASSGTYSALNPSLELYNKEIYTLTITTPGAYGTAKFTASSLSDSTSEITIPATPGQLINVGQYGLKVNFIGVETFSTNNSWTIEVSKPNLNVTMDLLVEEMQLTNSWSCTTEKITIDSGILVIYNSISYPVDSAVVTVTYLANHSQGSKEIILVSNSSQVTQYLGTIDSRNPIAFGASLALENSNGNSIRCIYPEYDSLLGWQTLCSYLENKSEIYRYVPLTHDITKIDTIVSHVLASVNKWKDCIICRKLPTTLEIVNSTATIVLNGVTQEYSLMQSTSANFAQAKIGDYIDYLGSTYQVKKVNTPTELEFTPAALSGQPVPVNVRIYRYPTVQDKIGLYEYYAQNYANKRVANIVPDTFIKSGTLIPGYFMAAAVSGIKQSTQINQPITNYEIAGIDDLSNEFSEDQLDEIATAGNMIITKDTGSLYIRHQLTTDTTSVQTRELSMAESYDYICYGILNIAKPFIGKYNIHPGVLAQLSSNITGYLSTLTQTIVESAGPILLDSQILKLEPDPTQEDKILIQIRVHFPYPLNYMDITIIA